MAPRMAAASTIHGKSSLKKKMPTKASAAIAISTSFFSDLRADAPGREQHHRDHGRLDAVEDALHRRHVAEVQVDAGQQREQHEGRQEEQHAGHHRALDAVHQPADVDGELDRLRPRQQHAVVERVQVAVLGNPAAALDQFLVHHRNLPGRAAEADEAELEPVFEGFAEGRGRRWGGGDGGVSHVDSPVVVRIKAVEDAAGLRQQLSSSGARRAGRPARLRCRPLRRPVRRRRRGNGRWRRCVRNAGSVSRPKLAASTSKVTRSGVAATWVKVAPSKSKPSASVGQSFGLSSQRNFALRVDEAADQPGRGHAIHPEILARRPGAPRKVGAGETADAARAPRAVRRARAARRVRPAPAAPDRVPRRGNNRSPPVRKIRASVAAGLFHRALPSWIAAINAP